MTVMFARRRRKMGDIYGEEKEHVVGAVGLRDRDYIIYNKIIKNVKTNY